ncbi:MULTISPECIES: TIGR01548 family HAD-type hydrolase [Moorena]|uniref:Haloacid dehalogenase superfamily, subfamily IA hydrolase, TIGR01548 n=1 Tax=Moorena producens 3L TaxID=489825 RepID=F4XQN7_9CYAN|nr:MULTISPECIES: TIGR01548 family HAD-type hydrolase [Moorena]EGJ33066.1 haloacid dehalogenase superfamily, subfamily IA hydrolase, TIGR01548 [Moorena producens 3L]NEP30349.1 TIGR01548 family HAD-type hydrolase [Moorena sp. SIO3B2]NEP64963.1 TIGR01548 family HAD-type hydrolase [Moorena sp. SIO3A5]NEQ04805.1 TIGR01548 family HAD-type hydrolase [Moorena sp. SIO4E2]NER89444.1 TIGR01548 family HAD-type hydrolase [Moorena sp. SIO3A2]
MPSSETFIPNLNAIVVFDIDGVVRDVSGSYRRAIADTVDHYTGGAYRPTMVEIDQLKSEGLWNNDWDASQELVYRYFEAQGKTRSRSGSSRASHFSLDYEALVDFFNSRYRGKDPNHWTGYICDEPLLLQPSYLESLTTAGIPWGFFSGATRQEANYALEGRLGLERPVLIAMEDAPGKPDPTGLFAVVLQLEQEHQVKVKLPVIYVGDTVADMYTVEKARDSHPERVWVGVGILPPHVQQIPEQREAYGDRLKAAGATVVFDNVEQLTPEQIEKIVHQG